MNYEEKLQQIFREVLDLGYEADCLTISRLTCDAWDSLAHATLIAAFESEFQVSFDIEQMLSITSYSAALNLLNELLA